MDILDFLRYYKNIKICFVTIFVFSGLHKNKNKLVCQAQHFNFYKIKFGSNAMWIERTQLKKNSVAFRFGKKCTYTYTIMSHDQNNTPVDHNIYFNINNNMHPTIVYLHPIQNKCIVLKLIREPDSSMKNVVHNK